MIDAVTKKPLVVSTIGTAGPSIRVSLDEVEKVTRLLETHGIRHSVRNNSISMDGGPFMTVVKLGYDGNAVLVQSLLDAAA